MKSLLFLSSLLLAASLAISTVESQCDAPWQQIDDVDTPHVRAVALFAVKEYNKSGRTQLLLLAVNSGQYQIHSCISQIDFRIKIVAAVNNPVAFNADYEAGVVEKLEGHFELTSFEYVGH